MRLAAIAFAAWLFTAPAFALEPEDVLGEWVTVWGNQGGEPLSGGAPMRITLDSPGALDGVWPSPGADGVIYGEAVARPDGTLVWEGDWASIWPEGVTRGAFRFVFTDADSFTGTWSTDDGEIVDAPWNGRRAE